LEAAYSTGGVACKATSPVRGQLQLDLLLRLKSSEVTEGTNVRRASGEFLCGRRFHLIQKIMEGSGGEVDHRGFGPKGYFVSIFQLIGLV